MTVISPSIFGRRVPARRANLQETLNRGWPTPASFAGVGLLTFALLCGGIPYQ